MIVHGMEDVINPPQNAQILADAIPGSWLIRLAGDGHGGCSKSRTARRSHERISQRVAPGRVTVSSVWASRASARAPVRPSGDQTRPSDIGRYASRSTFLG